MSLSATVDLDTAAEGNVLFSIRSIHNYINCLPLSSQLVGCAVSNMTSGDGYNSSALSGEQLQQVISAVQEGMRAEMNGRIIKA